MGPRLRWPAVSDAGEAWEQAVGPLLSEERACERLGLSARQLGELADIRRVLALQERSGARRYPAWQFDQAGRPLEPLIAAHRLLVRDGGMSPWSAAAWCVREHPELDGRSPREWAAAGERVDALLRAARRDASRGSR